MAGAKKTPTMTKIMMKERRKMAMKVGHRPLLFFDLIDPPPFCNERKEVAAGEGKRSPVCDSSPL